MIEILQSVDRLRLATAEAQDRLAKQHHVAPGDPPLGGLGMVYNMAVMCLELLHYYHQLWSKLPATAVADPEQTRHENGERVMLITKTLFIQSMSGVEFSAKDGLTRFPGRLPPLTGRIYLRRIIEASATSGYIAPADVDLWVGAVEVRNTLVHNNGIAETSASYAFPGATLTLQVGKMVQGKLDTFTALTHWATDAFARWCDRFLP